ncbi:MAG: adenylate/guanylate cyclase domain-containing protein [Candidatus Methanoperedens sp.]|nr:adenylate/guanylate cyclase domain-containing protein [Candidatus Methanoperedens sp.]
MEGIPIYYSPLAEVNFRKYLEKARSDLLDNWDIKYNLPKEAQISDLFLENATDNVLQFVILYVDLAGSTKLSSELDIDTYSKIIKIFLMQMAKVVNNSRGYVLKYVGDCIIGYFPAETNYTGMCDNAISGAMLMGIVVDNVINPVFISKGFPEIGFHIGIDVGKAKVTDIGAKGISCTPDILGEVMNLTAKIQALTGRNEIMIGENVYHLIHFNWQEMCSEVILPGTWQHISKDTGEKYKIYKFTPSSIKK